MALELYKPDEATKPRGGIAFVLAALLLHGISSLYDYLAAGFWQADLTGGLLGDEFPISPRVVVCVALILGAAFGIYTLCNHKKVVDFLISTEQEMQKVSWPARHEVISSSIVVCVTVLILAAYLGLVDAGLVMFKDKIPWDRFWARIFG